MTIGTSLFHSISRADMTRLSAEISEMQAQISSGKKDPRPSSDLVSALRLSAAKTREDALDSYASNVDRARSRLDQTDIVLGEATNILRRISELAIGALSDTASPGQRASVVAEVETLRGALLGAANARDETGRALFGGFSDAQDPYVDQRGVVTFAGDAGQATLPVSESLRLATGVNGQDVFASGEARGAFEAVDAFLTLLKTGVDAPGEITVAGPATLDFGSGTAPEAWQLTLEGPAGTARIGATIAEGAQEGIVAAINAESAATGISASLDPVSGAVVLNAAGEIRISDIQRPDEVRGTRLTVTDGAGAREALVADADTRESVLTRLAAGTETIIDQRTRVGALSADAGRQREIITSRQTEMEAAISGLEDLDLAAALTRLQEALLTRQASQQTYAQITQQSLFDFIR
ncbi:MAG: flagellar hook-associated protein FlgL [Pseudomonadota bacterium]